MILYQLFEALIIQDDEEQNISKFFYQNTIWVTIGTHIDGVAVFL